MTRLAAVILSLALVQSATAQELFELPLVAPCAQAESRAAVAPALIAAGWSQIKLDSDRGRDIIRAAGQGVEGWLSFPDAFTDVADVQAFIEQASNGRLLSARGFPELYATFERDGIVLLIRHGRASEVDLECMFAAQDFPLAEQLLAASVDVERGALRMRRVDAERPGAERDSLAIFELSAPEAALPLLTGRYSIFVQHFYAADQLPD